MSQCWRCGKKLTEAEFDEAVYYLDQGILCSRHLADFMGWLDYG